MPHSIGSTGSIVTEWYLNPKFLFGVLSFVNLLNFIDRGVIPGATNEFDAFIGENVDTTTPDVYLGLLQSAFIVGLVLGSVSFGHAIHMYGRFTLTGIGCTVWAAAVVMSGCARYAESYSFLVVARMLSGVGEASLQVSIPPWIQKTAHPKEKSTFLALFYTAVPVGTAIGYAYSSIVAGSIGWEWAFFIEAAVMAPLILFMFSISHNFPCDHHHHGLHSNRSRRSSVDGCEAENTQGDDLQAIDSDKMDPSDHSAVLAAQLGDPDESTVCNEEPPSVLDELRIVLSHSLFIFLCLGYAAQTATLIGLSTFGSAFFMGLGYFNSESQSSTVFGVLVSLAGVIATPLGGIMLDRHIAATKARRGLITATRNTSCSSAGLEGPNSSVGTRSASVTFAETRHDAATSGALQEQPKNSGCSNSALGDGSFRKCIGVDSSSLGQPSGHELASNSPLRDRLLPAATTTSSSTHPASHAPQRGLGQYSSVPAHDLDDEAQTSAGAAGAVGGGSEIFAEDDDNEDDDPNIRQLKLSSAFTLMTASNALGALVLCAVYFAYPRSAFLALVFVGCCLLFYSMPCINISVMLSVPTDNQSLAIAVSVVIMHALGDVPSPIIVGLLKDTLAPGCVPDDDDDGADAATSDECRDDKAGLRLCFLLVCMWLFWTILLFTVGGFVNEYSPHHTLSCCLPSSGSGHAFTGNPRNKMSAGAAAAPRESIEDKPVLEQSFNALTVDVHETSATGSGVLSI